MRWSAEICGKSLQARSEHPYTSVLDADTDKLVRRIDFELAGSLKSWLPAESSVDGRKDLWEQTAIQTELQTTKRPITIILSMRHVRGR